MKTTLTELLPLAAVIAISPVPILAVIMMLLTDRERANPLAFLAGWVCILTVLVVGALLSGIDSVSTTPSKTVAVIFVAVGVALIALAIHEWRLRPRHGEPHRIEPWMKFLHTVTPPRAFALGIGLVIVAVKDLLSAVQAGAVIHGDSLPAGQEIVAIAFFVVVSSLLILIPIAVAASFGERALPTLHRWRNWLERHGRLVLACLFALIALLLLLQGLSVLF
ncbi:unannotated protein [freshwater metagenome]|uniref:Unannotated protein n=1 Tax=freshwater metagenome TaxID=449393 RepID=A0A6J5ZTP0_9ZZZZ|nr:hypothetical protein [Actinomycetota bacterium]